MNVEIDAGEPMAGDPDFVETVEVEEEQIEVAEHEIEAEESDKEVEQVEQQEPEQTPLTENALRAINKKHFQYKEEERKRIALEQELEKLRSQQQVNNVNVPEMPDRYDYDTDAEFENAKAKYNEAITLKAQQDAQQAAYQAQQWQLQQQQKIEAQQKAIEAERVLLDNAKESGITQEKLMQAAQTIGAYNLGDNFANELMTSPNSAQLITALANNPMELENLSNMNDYQRGVYFATKILPSAANIKPKQTSAPKPPKSIQGKGADPEMGKFRNIQGASFE